MATNVTTSAETRLSKSANFARVREIEFVNIFNSNIRQLVRALGVTRMIPKESGAVLKVLKVTGTLQDGSRVGEGEIIPLSEFQTTWETVGNITLKKWRKATSIEAINEKGYDQAVTATTDKMLKLIQGGIRSDFFSFLATGGTATSGVGFQNTLANTWGQLQVLFEDNDIEAVYFMNPLDVAQYLGTHTITLETVFGMSYVKNFLGLGDVFFSSSVPSGKIYATAKENIVCYFVKADAPDISDAFDFYTDDTGLIGIKEIANYERDTVDDSVVSGVTFFAEKLDGIVVATINEIPST
jgi:hypothetical protein